MKWRETNKEKKWTVPYLLIDPRDIGRDYEADVIRINSQSGKGGIAYILEKNFGYELPAKMREEVGYFIKDISDRQQKELVPEAVFSEFKKEYINRASPIDITDAVFEKLSPGHPGDGFSASIDVVISRQKYSLHANGNGRLDAVSNALKTGPYNFDYTFVTYSEHALSSDSTSLAAAYVAIADSKGKNFWGVGTHEDIIFASIKALVSALNRQNSII